MIRIGRDHGKFRHEVGQLPHEELVIYAANYKFEFDTAEAARKKAESKAKNK